LGLFLDSSLFLKIHPHNLYSNQQSVDKVGELGITSGGSRFICGGSATSLKIRNGEKSRLHFVAILQKEKNLMME
jgi:hypothetical protein